VAGQAKQQKILTPTFDPKTQPGYQSRFSNSPFQKFFGSWQVPLIEGQNQGHELFPEVETDPRKQFNSRQDPRTIPSRMRK